MQQENQEKFIKLRNQFSTFTYNHYQFQIIENKIDMQFDFCLGDETHFQPKMSLSLGRHAVKEMKKEDIDGLIFHIGMIELISYWKVSCAPIVHIRPRTLTTAQQQWWKKLYWKGLGEFFYQNSITTSMDEFLQFHFDTEAPAIDHFHYQKITDTQSTIVPIGGGKDSVVTLEHLRKQQKIIPFIINPRGATLACARIAGFPEKDDIVILQREISPVLLSLNQQGYLNGHTPFSAMLAFYTLLVSYATNTRNIALSNESSANEPTIPGTDINHQYSKSLEFEEDFRQYVHDYMNDCSHYFSYLRPYRELDIAQFFSQYPHYFPVFKSCNVGSKSDSWCCHCPKCLFAYIILSPFIDDKTLISIFGEDLLNKASLKEYFDELSGIAEKKPFECVGTIDEVNKALSMIAESKKEKYLIKHWLVAKKIQ